MNHCLGIYVHHSLWIDAKTILSIHCLVVNNLNPVPAPLCPTTNPLLAQGERSTCVRRMSDVDASGMDLIVEDLNVDGGTRTHGWDISGTFSWLFYGDFMVTLWAIQPTWGAVEVSLLGI